MSVRTRGLDITACAAKLKADGAARPEAELVVDGPIPRTRLEARDCRLAYQNL
jgi:hypothetical protein